MRDYVLPIQEHERTDRTTGNHEALNVPCIVRIGNKHAAKVGQVAAGMPLHFRKQAPKAGGRAAVTEFTSASQMRAMWTFEEVLSGIEWTGFITLTYQDAPKNGMECKLHFKRFAEKVERLPGGSGCRMFWWMEFQRRGAVHFHVALSGGVQYIQEDPGPKPGFHWRGKADANVLVGSSRWACREWSRIIGQENPATAKHSARWERVKCAESLPSYLAKYVRKKDQKTVPDCLSDVGRFWGVRGCADKKTAARGMAKVYVPAYLLQGTSEIFGPGACPFRFQWNQAETLRAWAETEEGQAYQSEAIALVKGHQKAMINNGVYKNGRGKPLPQTGDFQLKEWLIWNGDLPEPEPENL